MQVPIRRRLLALAPGFDLGRRGRSRWPLLLLPILIVAGLGLGIGWLPGTESTDDRGWVPAPFIQRLATPWEHGAVNVWVEPDARLEVRGPEGLVGSLMVSEPVAGTTQRIPFKVESNEEPISIPIPAASPRALRLELDPSSVQTVTETLLIIPDAGSTHGDTITPSGGSPSGDSDLVGSMAGRNVLLVLTDALHASHMGCYGNERPTTPFLDQLSRAGVLFEETYSQSSWTIPSVATLFTSLEQEVHGVLTPGDAWLQEHPTLAEAFQDGGYRTHAIIQNGVVSERKGYAEGFDTFEYCPGSSAGIQEACRKAVRFLEEEKGVPHFVYLHLLPPHGPVDVPDPTSSRFDPDYGGSIVGSVEDSFDLNRRGVDADDPDTRHLRALYDEWLAICDRRLGTTLGPLLRGPDGDSLLVLHTSDHGEAFMQHDRQGHCDHVYEEMVRVPWILMAPNSELPRGVRLEGRTSLLDVYPTLLELVGLEVPEVGPRGRSRLPWIEGRASAPESPLVLSARYRPAARGPQQAIVVDGFKWIRSDGTKRTSEGGALFDLAHDPGESHDVQGDHPVLAKALDGRLEAWLETQEAHRDGLGHAAMRREPDSKELEALELLGYVEESPSPTTPEDSESSPSGGRGGPADGEGQR